MAGQIKAVIFDFDGTLVDTEQYRILSWEQSLSQEKVDYDPKLLVKLIHRGLDNESLIRELAQETLNDDQIQAILHEKDKLRLQYLLNDVQLSHEARAVIEILRAKGYKIGICSGNSRVHIVQFFEQNQLGSVFSNSTVVGKEDSPHQKPHSFLLQVALTKLGVVASEALYVGDTIYDQEMASSLGVSFLLLDPHPSKSSQYPHLILTKLSDLLQLRSACCESHYSEQAEDAGHSGWMKEQEYVTIKKEILQYQRLRVQILAFTVAAIAALVGLVLNAKQSSLTYLCAKTTTELARLLVFGSLAPYIVLLPSALLIGMLNRHISSLGAFLAVAHEGMANHMGWYLSRYVQDKYARRMGFPRGVLDSTRWGYSLAYLVITAFVGGFSWFYTRFVTSLYGMSEYNIIYVINAVALIAMLCIIIVYILPVVRIRRKAKNYKRMLGTLDYFDSISEDLIGWLRKDLEKK